MVDIYMADVKDFVENMPHVVGETICLKCYHRWVAVMPEGSYLKNMQCPNCNKRGYVIATGQIIWEDDCDT